MTQYYSIWMQNYKHERFQVGELRIRRKQFPMHNYLVFPNLHPDSFEFTIKGNWSHTNTPPDSLNEAVLRTHVTPIDNTSNFTVYEMKQTISKTCAMESNWFLFLSDQIQRFFPVYDLVEIQWQYENAEWSEYW